MSWTQGELFPGLFPDVVDGDQESAPGLETPWLAMAYCTTPFKHWRLLGLYGTDGEARVAVGKAGVRFKHGLVFRLGGEQVRVK